VRLGDKVTDVPMHGKKRDLPTGTVNRAKSTLTAGQRPLAEAREDRL
jgi:hypothetical protein